MIHWRNRLFWLEVCDIEAPGAPRAAVQPLPAGAGVGQRRMPLAGMALGGMGVFDVLA